MKKFIIERDLPGAGKLSQEELTAIAKTSCDVINQMGNTYVWLETFVTGDKMFCVHIAESEAMVREHAKMGKFPVTSVMEVKTVIDPMTSMC